MSHDVWIDAFIDTFTYLHDEVTVVSTPSASKVDLLDGPSAGQSA